MKQTSYDNLRPQDKPAWHRQNGFEAIRWALCFLLVWFHYCTLNDWDAFVPLSPRLIVASFFVLSGLLCWANYRPEETLCCYLLRRARRILPAYWTTIVFCIGTGAAVSHLSLSEYWTNSGTWKYLVANATFLNFLCPALPGVFANHASTAVNGSLWTMKIEIAFYLLLPLLYRFIQRRNQARALLALFVFSLSWNVVFEGFFQHTGADLYDFLRRQLPGQLVCFLAGIAVALYGEKLRRRQVWLLPAALLLVIGSFYTESLRILCPLGVAILLMRLAQIRKLFISRKLPAMTYEVFLLHFPVIQLFVWADVPQRWGHAVGFIAALLTTLTLSACLHALVLGGKIVSLQREKKTQTL